MKLVVALVAGLTVLSARANFEFPVPVDAGYDLIQGPQVLPAAFKPATIHIDTDKTSSKDFITKGYLEKSVPLVVMARVLERYPEYNTWAIKDINKNYKDRGFLVLIKSLQFKDKTLTTYFDLNLPWPFNFKNLTLDLEEAKKETSDDALINKVRFEMKKGGVALNKFSLDLNLTGTPHTSRLDFVVNLQISQILSPFFSKEKYVKNVESRLLQVMHNLDLHLLNQATTR